MTAPQLDFTSIITSYKLWLRAKSYSSATVRNYLVDLKKYFQFSYQDNSDSNQIFNGDNLTAYLQNINQDQNYKRFLASLSKFFQFALDQHLISENPFNQAVKAKPESSLQDIIKLYQDQLIKKKFSISTIRNYINDVQQFINWAIQEDSRPVKGDVRRTEGFVQ